MMRKNTQKKCRTKIDGKKSAPYGSAGSKKILLFIIKFYMFGIMFKQRNPIATFINVFEDAHVRNSFSILLNRMFFKSTVTDIAISLLDTSLFHILRYNSLLHLSCVITKL